MSDLTAEEAKRLRELLIGEVEPLAQYGVGLMDVPWWRRRIQRYVAPRRYTLWWQRQILADLEAES